MGPTRLSLGKPVIAAIEGPAVAGGLELALWCDLRIAARSADFGIFNRRFGVPLVDLGTIRLPRIVGQGRALELILTGRAVGAEEALRIGLVNEMTEDGEALTRALALARTLSGFPQTAMRNDRLSALEQWDLGRTGGDRQRGRPRPRYDRERRDGRRAGALQGRPGPARPVRTRRPGSGGPSPVGPCQSVHSLFVHSARYRFRPSASQEGILVLKRVSLRGQVRLPGVEIALKQAEQVHIENSRRLLRPAGIVLDDAVLAPPRHHIRLIAGRGFLIEFGPEVIEGEPFVRLNRVRGRREGGSGRLGLVGAGKPAVLSPC